MRFAHIINHLLFFLLAAFCIVGCLSNGELNGGSSVTGGSESGPVADTGPGVSTSPTPPAIPLEIELFFKGLLDTTFNRGMRYLRRSYVTEVVGMAVRGDKIAILNQYIVNLPSGQTVHQYWINRYKANGTVDLDGGANTNEFEFSRGVVGSDIYMPRTIALDSQGQVLIAGDVMTFDAIAKLFVARYKINGQPDSRFGTGGRIAAYVVGDSYGYDPYILEDMTSETKRIFVAENFVNSGSVSRLFAFRQDNGDLDESFYTTGIQDLPNTFIDGLFLKGTGSTTQVVLATREFTEGNSSLGTHTYMTNMTNVTKAAEEVVQVAAGLLLSTEQTVNVPYGDQILPVAMDPGGSIYALRQSGAGQYRMSKFYAGQIFNSPEPLAWGSASPIWGTPTTGNESDYFNSTYIFEKGSLSVLPNGNPVMSGLQMVEGKKKLVFAEFDKETLLPKISQPLDLVLDLGFPEVISNEKILSVLPAGANILVGTSYYKSIEGFSFNISSFK